MKAKIQLILILTFIFFIILISSASAATCVRVDASGDYSYQCDGIQITQTARTLFNDAVNNFTNSATAASWDFYDGLTQTSAHYSSSLSSYNFGGMYVCSAVKGASNCGACIYNNPVTNTCGCPANYSSKTFINYKRGLSYETRVCLANSNVSQVANFGGMYSIANNIAEYYSGSSFITSSLTYKNPVTNDFNCPSGYKNQQFWVYANWSGIPVKDYKYCYNTNSSIQNVSIFGGTYTNVINNPFTNSFSCTYGDSESVVGETTDGNLNMCYQKCDGTAQVNLTISTSTQNYDLFTAAGSPSCPVNVNLTINSGVNISSPVTSKAAIWGSKNLPTGSTVKITNNGVIYGMGGDGGQDGTPSHQASYLPTNGGPAINLIGNTYITNNSGYIFGGGGGGAQQNPAPAYYTLAGGGGAGGGIGGIRWGNAKNGTTGLLGVGGDGGTAGYQYVGQDVVWQHGNKGGNYGESGVDGTFSGGLAGNSVITNSFYLCITGNSSSTVKGPIAGAYDTSCNSITPTVTISSNSPINYNASAIINWSSKDANSCSALWTSSTSTNATTTITNLKQNTDFGIACTGSGGITYATTTVLVKPQNPINPPDLTLSPTNPDYNLACGGSIKIKWDSVSNAEKYELYRSVTNESSYVGLISTTSLSVEDYSFINGNKYYYKVRACNDAVCSDFSPSVSTTVPTQCNDSSTFDSTTIPAYCTANQDGINKIYTNRQMQWTITGDSMNIPPNTNTAWSGTSITGVKSATTTFNNIYTTVGLKTIYATSTWTNGNINYTASCSTSTNVIPGGDIIREI